MTTILITGANRGIGFALAKASLARGWTVYGSARTQAQADETAARLGPDFRPLTFDVTDHEAVRQAAAGIGNPIDILINNAGALFNERKETSEGFEQTFATDLLGVFYLTELLKKVIARSSGRIINVSSGGMYTQKIAVEDLENRQPPYNGAKAYARAKRGVVILTRIWAQELEKDGITVHAMHPGWVDTPGIQRSLPGFHSLVGNQLRTPEQGADTIVWLALSETAARSTGRFWLDRRPHETVVFPGTGESEQERLALWRKLHGMISGLP